MKYSDFSKEQLLQLVEQMEILNNQLLKENETNKTLTKEISKHIAFESALMRDAVFATEANLTQNKVIRGLEFYDEFLERIHYDYDKWFEFAKSNVQQEYRDTYIKSICRKNLILRFYVSTL